MIRRYLNATLVLACTLLVPVLGSPAMAKEAHWPDMARAASPVGGGTKDAALVVGIEHYAFVPGVPGARRNALAWFDWLVRTLNVPLDRVFLLRDQEATKERILREAGQAARQAREGGTLWFVFIGHGAPSSKGKDALLVGVDAQQRADSLEARGVSLADLYATLQKTHAARIGAVIDACFSGRTAANAYLAKGLQPLVVTSLSPVADPRFVVLTAAKGDQFAGSMPGLDRPAFSYLVLGGLRGWADKDGDGRITAGELYAYAGSALRVMIRDREQEPTLLGPAGAVLAPSGREQGPDLAALVRVESNSGAFHVTALPALPAPEAPSDLSATTTELGALREVDVESLEKYAAVVRFDKSDASPDDKAARWRDLARSEPKFSDVATKRAVEWKRFGAQQRAAEEARRKRAAARDADWERLRRLLDLTVVADAEKRRWATAFVQAYGTSVSDNPYAPFLAPWLPKGTIQMRGSGAGGAYTARDLGLQYTQAPARPDLLPESKTVSTRDRDWGSWHTWTVVMGGVVLVPGVTFLALGGGSTSGLGKSAWSFTGVGSAMVVGALLHYIIFSGTVHTSTEPDEDAIAQNRRTLSNWEHEKARAEAHNRQVDEKVRAANQAVQRAKKGM